jgi:transcriptional regulator with XRE-family HTH domain
MRNLLIKLGGSIKQRRELLGLLQPQLATISGVSTRTIQMIEQGKANPSIGTLIRLTDPLGLTIQLMLKDLSKNNDE